MAQMKEQSKTSGLSDEEIANQSDGEFKGWYQNAHRTDWAWSKNEKTNERHPKWKIKQSTNSDRKETRAQSNDLEQKGKINIQLEQNEETRIQKSEERLMNL